MVGEARGGWGMLHNPTTSHWNDDIPGWAWSQLYTAAHVGSYVSHYCGARQGVYRIVGLNADEDVSAIASLDRVCDSDHTGTLYIGRTNYQRSLSNRLGQLVRSIRKPCNLACEHTAINRLRKSLLLSNRFPEKRLAFAWCYEEQPYIAESELLDAYFRSFGEIPPLNRRQGL